jgi:iron complex outermembrane recepter protein
MNRTRSTLVGTAVAIALFGQNDQARAAEEQDAKAVPPPRTALLEEVVVSGIRFSIERSLDAKRAADTVVEVITAEEIGKMPDKNVADSLARVPGVTISSASANEGGFDENDRVSMRGTNPSLTQTLLNGHNVAAGDWFVLNQVQQVGRSVSYTLLPSELVDHVVVRKSSQASLVEGGVAGSVDIITRRPLGFKEQMTFSASVGTVYAEQPDKFDPQLSGLFSWKNDANNFGVLVQAFSEVRHLRRDGVELLGYETIAPGSAIATSNPDLSGVQYPALIGAALFEQKRERTGGLIDIEFQPSDDLSLDAQFFTSELDAANYNRNYLMWNTRFIASGAGQAPDPGYVVTNGTLTQASFSPVSGTFYGVYDQISRPDESASSNFGSLEAKYRVSDKMSLSGQIGTSTGHGKTPTQDVSETLPGTGNGASYSLHGTGSAPDFSFGATDNSTPFPGGTPVDFGWIFGAQFVDVKDEETWAKVDAEYAIDHGAWTMLKFGARFNEHQRESLGAIAQGPTFSGGTTGGGGVDPANYPTTFTNYPSDFNTFGGSFPTDVWYWTPAQLEAYNGPGDVQRDPLARAYYQFLFEVQEKNSAAYVQADFRGSNWSGNIGVRAVQTKEDIVTYTQTAASNPDATTTSLFGPFVGIPVDHTYNDVLPSANLKWDVSEDVVARFAVSKTMTRPDYSALAGFTDLSPPATVGGTGTGAGGNPDLKPIRSTNFDAGVEWYFAKNSLLSAGLFYMDLDNYVGFGSEVNTYFTYSTLFPNGADVPYLLTVPVNAEGRVKGVELAYQQALTDNIGVAANYTYADGKQTSLVTNGDDRLVGNSKNTYNASAYFENARFNARVTYTHRSAFFSGLDRNTAFSQDEIGSLAASLGFKVNENVSVTLDGQNLNDATLKYYARNKDQPRAFYKNGAQYYMNVRVKF